MDKINISKIVSEKPKSGSKNNDSGAMKISSFSASSSELKNKKADDVINDLKDIERQYYNKDNVDAPDSLSLSKTEVEDKSDDELKALAESSLRNKYEQKKQSTTADFSKQIDDLLKEQEQSKESSARYEEKVNQAYDDSIKSTEDQALKRGLARSSIIIGQIAELEGGRAKELSQNMKDLESGLSGLETKMHELEQERDRAMSDLDLQYAADLQSEFESVKEDYLKRRQEAIEFNNNVEKLEAEYKLKLDKQKMDKQTHISKLEDEYGMAYTYNNIKNAQVEYLEAYLDSLDKDYALALLKYKSEFKDILKERYDEVLRHTNARN